MNNPWMDKMKAAGWNAQSLYLWQHKDGRQLERADDGYWYMYPPVGKALKLGKSMGDAFSIAVQYVYTPKKGKARV